VATSLDAISETYLFLYFTKRKEWRLRQNLPAEPEAKRVVVAWFWVVKSLGRFLQYIGRFWCSERVGCRCRQQWVVVLLRWREFDTRVVERDAMEHGLRKQKMKTIPSFCLLHSKLNVMWEKQLTWHVLWLKISHQTRGHK